MFFAQSPSLLFGGPKGGGTPFFHRNLLFLGAQGEALHFSIEIFYFWEPPQFCFFGDGTTKLTRFKKRKKKRKSRTCEAPRLIYMKENISRGGFIMGVLGRVFLGGAILVQAKNSGSQF